MLYMPTIWGLDIEVVREDDGDLLVFGKLPIGENRLTYSVDPYFQYRRWLKSTFAQKHSGNKPPHLRFANAKSDKELIAFVSEFGPIAPYEVEIFEPPDAEDFRKPEDDFRQTIFGAERLASLRHERRVYAAILHLMLELRRGKKKYNAETVQKLVDEIVDGAESWPDQSEAEIRRRKERIWGNECWQFDKQTLDYLHTCQVEISGRIKSESDGRPDLTPSVYWTGHRVICRILDSLHTELWCFEDHPVETFSYGTLHFGIRPTLYLILRHEYLGRGGTAICANDRCGDFFVSQRAGQKHCDDDCSRKARQRKYWATKGSRKRKAREREKKRQRKSRASINKRLVSSASLVLPVSTEPLPAD